jgi:FlaA1/EpsC-like NDP-sugar epimerase
VSITLPPLREKEDPPPLRSKRRPDGLLRTVIVGAGEAGRMIARDLRRAPDFGLQPIGFIDDDGSKKRIDGLPVLGTIDLLGDVAQVNLVDVVVIAIPSLRPADIRSMARRAAAAGVSVRFLPSFANALERDARLEDLRRLDLGDLLGRREVHVTGPGARTVVASKCVLVTGAGGSVGSELAAQIRGFGPSRLVLLDHDETNLHKLQMTLDGHGLLDDDSLAVADIRDRRRMMHIFNRVKPDVVFHAAAHKHLPLLERHPTEAAKSNVLGTENLVDAALATGVGRFILISTDKAADPTSVLGATKRMAELLLQARTNRGTSFASVRFGNVLGSRGSLLSVVAEQIASGEAVTVTHPDVTRYFMTLEEAAGLVIEAASMAQDGEIFILDMGEPVRIVDLVRRLATQVHLSDSDVPIRFTGLRPGEKLDESLSAFSESLIATAHPGISVVSPHPASRSFDHLLRELRIAAEDNDDEGTINVLRAAVSGYRTVAVEQAVPSPYPDWY